MSTDGDPKRRRVNEKAFTEEEVSVGSSFYER